MKHAKQMIIASFMMIFLSAAAAADDLRTIYVEEFDRYGDVVHGLTDAVSIHEAPASLKHLSFSGEKQSSAHRKMFDLPKDANCINYDFSFLVRFPSSSTRIFDLTLFSGSDDKNLKRLTATIDAKGSSFKGAPAGALPQTRLTSRHANLPGFPDNRWHKILVQVRGKSAVLFVERDGIMTREAGAESFELPLRGFNFASATRVDIDSIVIRAGDSTQTPDFVQNGKRMKATHAAEYAFATREDADDVTFYVCSGSYPANFSLKFTTDDGTNNVFTFSPFAQNYDKPMQREVSELIDGELKTTFKFVNDRIVLADSGFSVTGPNNFSLKLFTRPNLQWRYKPEQAIAIVSKWEEYPAASKSDIHFRITRSEQGNQLWIDDKYATSFGANLRLVSVTATLSTDGEIEVVSEGKKIQSASSKGAQALQTPLHTEWNARPGPLALAKTTLPAQATVHGVKFNVADGAASLDAGRCRENQGSFMLECDGYLQRSAFDGMPESLHFRVPTAQYIKAYALCAVADEFDKVPIITARLTKFRPGDGRQEAICDSTLELPRTPGGTLPKGVQLAGEVICNDHRIPLYFVEFSFDAGSIQDVLMMEDNPFLDFEFVGKLYNKDNFYLNRSSKPSEILSSVQVFAVTLEKSPAAFETKPGRLTNVYYPDERASMSATLKALQPINCAISWEVSNMAGKSLEKGKKEYALRKPGEEARLDLAFTQKEYGWYGVRFDVADEKGRTLFTRHDSFSLLPPDTRKPGYESPYFVWNFFGAHGTPRDIEIIGDILKRMGVRRTLLGKLTEKDVEKWGLTLGQFRYLRFKGNTPEEREADAALQIKELTANYPHVKDALIFHEGGGGAFPMELLGGKTEIDEKEKQGQKQRAEQALFAAQMWRKYAPDIKMVVGNSGESLGIVARLMREKFPREYLDAMGEESVGMTMPPERSVAYPNWQLHELARVMGYGDIPVTACFEWKSRVVRHLGPEKQAAFKTRDSLISLAWRQNLVPVIGISEMANSYFNTIWGDGAFTRYPLLQPYPVFNATATLTLILDQAEFIKMLSTGSLTVYALEFKKSDGFIYALWTTRGELAAEIQMETDAPATCTTMMGVESKVENVNRRIALQVSESPIYLSSKSAIKAISVPMQREYPNEQYPGSEKAVVAAPMQNTADWTLVTGPDKRLEMPHTAIAFAAFRRPGAYELHQTNDDLKGPCLELLLQQTNDCPALMQEYAFLRLKEPVQVTGAPNTIGLWIKGNSSLGKIFWEFKDAEGETWLSAGTAGYGCNVYDWPDQAAINFDGWHMLQFPITEFSPVKVYSPGENQWQWQHDGSGSRKVEYPITITGIGVMQYRQVLNLLEMKPVAEPIRLKGVVVY